MSKLSSGGASRREARRATLRVSVASLTSPPRWVPLRPDAIAELPLRKDVSLSAGWWLVLYAWLDVTMADTWAQRGRQAQSHVAI